MALHAFMEVSSDLEGLTRLDRHEFRVVNQ